jgi:rare lipoprotein A
MISTLLIPVKASGRTVLPYFKLFIVAAGSLYGCRSDKPASDVTIISENAYEVDGRTYHRLDSAVGFREQGVASWYGDPFHKKKTANGEVYNMHAMTAAHKTLPFGTMVKVTNVENNKSTVVRINDRGPFCRDRIIDLSFRAAKEIEMIQNGTAPIEIIALGKDDAYLAAAKDVTSDTIYFTGDFTIQAGAFSRPENAENLKKSLEKIAREVVVGEFKKNDRTFYRVRVGRFNSLIQARDTEQRMIENGFENVYIVAWDL